MPKIIPIEVDDGLKERPTNNINQVATVPAINDANGFHLTHIGKGCPEIASTLYFSDINYEDPTLFEPHPRLQNVR